MNEKIEITEKAIRKSAGKETAFVDLLNKETKELSDSFDSYLLFHGYRKESDTAKEILKAVDEESNGQTVAVTNVLRKRYGVELTEDKE